MIFRVKIDYNTLRNNQSMLNIKLSPVAFSHEEIDASSLEGNLFHKHCLQVVKQLEGKLDLSVDSLTSCYDLDFPQEISINVNFVSPNQKEDLCSYFGFDSEKTLGFYATSTGDGFLDEKYYVDSFEVFVFCPDNDAYFEMVKKNNEYNHEDSDESLFRCLTTLTHELKHALVFIESSGGLTPHEVDNLCMNGEFDSDIFDCVSGCNLERLEDEFYFDGRAYTDITHQEINEMVVEEEGREVLSKLDINFKEMARELEDACGKEFYPNPVRNTHRMR